KFAILFLLARLFRFSTHAAILTGLLMMPFDEFAYVILASANSSGLLTEREYIVGLCVISLSFVVSPVLINLGYKLRANFGQRPEDTPQKLAALEQESVVVAGYGYVGRAICVALEQAGVRYTAFDVELDWLAEARALAHNVHYADVGDSAVLSAIAIERSRLVVATNGAHPSTRRMIDYLRQFHPGVPVVVAVPYLAQRDELRRAGTDAVFALAPEGVLSFGRRVLG